VCRTALFVTVQKDFRVYYRSSDCVKLFRFLLSPYSLLGDLQQSADRHFWLPYENNRGGGGVYLCIILGGPSITKSEDPKPEETGGRSSKCRGNEYQDSALLGCDTAQFVRSESAVRRKLLRPSL
jgi:hypothetical protein